MKKGILLLAMAFMSMGIARSQLLIAGFIMAGKKNDRIDTGVKIAAGFSSLSLSPANGIDETLNSKFAMNLGLTFDYALTPKKNLYLMSGIDFINKGSCIKGSPANESTAFGYLQQETLQSLGSTPQNASFAMSYIQLPIHLGYKYPISKKATLVVRGGGYLAYATGGFLKDDNIHLNVFGKLAKENDIEINRLDGGVGGALGAEFGKIKVTLGYDWGLTDLDKSATYSSKNKLGYLALGYQF